MLFMSVRHDTLKRCVASRKTCLYTRYSSDALLAALRGWKSRAGPGELDGGEGAAWDDVGVSGALGTGPGVCGALGAGPGVAGGGLGGARRCGGTSLSVKPTACQNATVCEFARA